MKRQPSYNIKTIRTANTYRFELHSRGSSKVLLWYSVPHNLREQGRTTFTRKVVDYYRQKKEEKATRLSTDTKAKCLLTRVTNAAKELQAFLRQQEDQDFLDKITRVNII